MLLLGGRTRTKILDASWDLIAREGVAVSMARIASEIGMTRQSIYVGFRTRGLCARRICLVMGEEVGHYQGVYKASQGILEEFLV